MIRYKKEKLVLVFFQLLAGIRTIVELPRVCYYLFLLSKSKNNSSKYKYTIVLNVYKRRYLSDQLECLLKQSSQPSYILIHQNGSFCYRYLAICINLFANSNLIKLTHHANWNTKYHGRIMMSVFFETDFVVMWDDDLTPEKGWNELTLKLANDNNCVVTANGRVYFTEEDLAVHDDVYRLFPRINNEICIEPESILLDQYKDINTKPFLLIDYGGHSWTFSSKVLEMILSHKPLDLKNSEDLHISAAAYLHSNINTIMPFNVPNNSRCFSNSFFNKLKGVDLHASHRIKKNRTVFLQQRFSHFIYWVQKGFLPLFKRP